ncbi:unnamed protein product [Orchesella dallaii]|uniref:Uncharacterized protein n=1 Tax=Orchesella dallaii TaxID=48710 RepID=A0ABP1R6N6_9HEXA
MVTAELKRRRSKTPTRIKITGPLIVWGHFPALHPAPRWSGANFPPSTRPLDGLGPTSRPPPGPLMVPGGGREGGNSDTK